jgi:ribonuclease Z
MADKATFTFLGTGSAIPTERRNHTGMYLQYKKENILIDCGEGTQRQFRKAKLSFAKINRILITHWHGDHSLGLPGMLQSMMLGMEQTKTIHLHGPVGSKEMFQNYMTLLNNRTGKLDVHVHEHKTGTVHEDEEMIITCKPMKHSVPTIAYSITLKERTRIDRKKLAALKLPNSPIIKELLEGKKVKHEGKTIDGKTLTYKEPARKLTIIMDTMKNEGMKEIAQDSDILITESSYHGDEEETAHSHKHMTCKQDAEIAKEANVKKLILTHPSQRYDEIPNILIKDAKKVFKNVSLAEDLDTFTF